MITKINENLLTSSPSSLPQFSSNTDQKSALYLERSFYERGSDRNSLTQPFAIWKADIYDAPANSLTEGAGLVSWELQILLRIWLVRK